MGKRKIAKPVRPKPKEKLDVVFNCPFCNHTKCVETVLDRKRSLGTLFCRVCDANYAIKVSPLTEPIDIYSEWIDRCEEENNGIDQTNCQTASTAPNEDNTENDKFL